MEENQQEHFFKLNMFEKQMQQLQQQLQAVEQSSIELDTLNLGLDELTGATGKEILAPVGRGIFANAKLLSEELTVDIGEKILVKKSIPETQKILQSQIKKLAEIKEEMTQALEKLNEEMVDLMKEQKK